MTSTASAWYIQISSTEFNKGAFKLKKIWVFYNMLFVKCRMEHPGLLI